jgi:hypothetical protein
MRRFGLILAMLGGMLLTAAPTAQAAVTTTVYHVRNGQEAVAIYQTVSGTRETSAFVDARSGIEQTPPGPPSMQQMVNLEVSVFDISTNTLIAGGTGAAVPTSIAFGAALSSATLVATIPMSDPFTGTPLGNAEVNLTWTGFGAVTKQTSTTHFRAPGFTVNDHSSVSFRPANVSGSILFGGVDYATTLLDGEIAKVQFSDVTIQH